MFSRIFETDFKSIFILSPYRFWCYQVLWYATAKTDSIMVSIIINFIFCCRPNCPGCHSKTSLDTSLNSTSCTSVPTTGWPNRRCTRNSRGGRCWPGGDGGADITPAAVPDTRKRPPWTRSSTSAYPERPETNATSSSLWCSSTKPIRKPKGRGLCTLSALRFTRYLIPPPGWHRSSWRNK